jgi:hypothetical protein
MNRLLLALSSCGLLFAACTPATGSDELDAKAKKKTATLSFAADWTESTSGPIIAGTKPKLVYDASRLAQCRGDQGGIPQWSLTAHYRLNGGAEKQVTVAGLNAVKTPTLEVGQAGDLELWFEVNDRWGCDAFDSDFGSNYHFTVVEKGGAPKWIGNEASVVARATCESSGGPCDADRTPLEDGFTYGTWARQRAAIAGVYFDVYQPGETDFDNPDLWKQLDVEVHLRAAGQPSFTTRYVDYFRKSGNDARYALDIRSIDPLGLSTVADASACPEAKLDVSDDGQYVRTTIEYYFTVNGAELRPAPSETFVATFEDYKNVYGACLGG